MTISRSVGPVRAAVLGHPVAHSLSPTLHRAAYGALGLEGWTYEAIDLTADELPGFLAGASGEGGWAGFSVTMPLKAAALELADDAETVARLVGAANTLTPTPGGGWAAANTDVEGIAEALRAGLGSGGPRDADGLGSGGPRDATVLGVGATARAATAALARLGVERIVYLARDVTRAGPVLELAGQLGLVAETRPFGTAGLAAEAAGPAPLVVSALPPRAADPLAAADLGDLTGAVLLDVAYDPWPSALAQAWARASGTVVPGLLMLARQAIPQVEAMTGLRPPAEPLEAALERTRPGGCAIVHGQREKVA